jgi:hypothetical protein
MFDVGQTQIQQVVVVPNVAAIEDVAAVIQYRVLPMGF